MILRRYPDVLSCYLGLTDELAYNLLIPREQNGENHNIKPLKWGVCVGYPEPLHVEIDDVMVDNDLHLDMSSYTKSRWTRFLRRYMRGDLPEWVDESMKKLNRYPRRPFVASYSVNPNTGHNYGGCLSSLQIRICPRPTVMLYSRACHIDKVGFLDLSFIHVVAKAMDVGPVHAEWTISNGFISAISQIYYIQRFQKSIEGNRLAKSMVRFNDVAYDDIKFGPLKRGRKRMESLATLGHIPGSVPVSKLSLNIVY